MEFSGQQIEQIRVEGSVFMDPSWGNMIASGEPPRDLYVPRQRILADFSAQTGLAHKYSSVTDENGLVKACVVVDVPFQIPGTPEEKTRAFYGDSKGDVDGALESAADLALRHLRDDYGCIITDYNAAVAIEYLQKLLDYNNSVAAEHMEKVLAAQEFYRRKAEAKREEAIRYKEAFDDVFQSVRDVLIEHAGLLPVRAGGRCGVEYVGPPSPPAGGLDKLALILFRF